MRATDEKGGDAAQFDIMLSELTDRVAEAAAAYEKNGGDGAGSNMDGIVRERCREAMVMTDIMLFESHRSVRNAVEDAVGYDAVGATATATATTATAATDAKAAATDAKAAATDAKDIVGAATMAVAPYDLSIPIVNV